MIFIKRLLLLLLLIIVSSNVYSYFFNANISNDVLASASVPTGAIVMWSGSTTTIPSGWGLCDGTNGTPDLRSKFVMAWSTSVAPGVTGGSNSNITLIEANLPAHTHTFTTGGISANHLHATNIGNSANIFQSGTNRSACQNIGGINTGYVSSDHSHSGTTGNGAGTSTSFSVLPAYYTLAFIMKL